MRKNTFWTVVAIIILLASGFIAVKNRLFGMNAEVPVPPVVATTTPPVVLHTVMYSCGEAKTIDASYSESAVDLTLSDGRNFNLPQVVSGSGIRYEQVIGTTTDTIFSSKGDNASFTENASTTYQDCIAGTVTHGSSASSTLFTTQSKTFSFEYPSVWSVTGDGGGYTQQWMVSATTSGTLLAQINVPRSYLPGTNFGDARFTVGTSADPSALATCLTYNPSDNKKTTSTTTTIHDVVYTVVQSKGAAAGNYYDTTSYRTAHNSQCYAIEYTIHYSNFKNYPKGAVKEFDETALKAVLDSIPQSFVFLQ